jgi:hypothetical protein
MRSSKRTDKRKLLSHIRALCNDPDFVAGAKEMLARKPKPFDYDGRRNNQAQINYEVGRQIAIRALQSSLCFLVMLALWAIPALAQQKWWVLARSFKINDMLLDTCKTTGKIPSPGDFYDTAKTAGYAPKIVDSGGLMSTLPAIVSGSWSLTFARRKPARRKLKPTSTPPTLRKRKWTNTAKAPSPAS